MREAIFPPSLAEAVAASGFSPAVRAGDMIYLTGATGGGPDGTMPDSAVRQTRNALNKVHAILDVAGVTPSAVVEVTSYHIGLREHFDDIDAIFREVLGTPLPAWTAVEVAGLRRPKAVIEMRFVVYAPQKT